MCVLSIKVPIRKKLGNLFNDPRIYIYIYIYILLVFSLSLPLSPSLSLYLHSCLLFCFSHKLYFTSIFPPVFPSFYLFSGVFLFSLSILTCVFSPLSYHSVFLQIFSLPSSHPLFLFTGVFFSSLPPYFYSCFLSFFPCPCLFLLVISLLSFLFFLYMLILLLREWRQLNIFSTTKNINIWKGFKLY